MAIPLYLINVKDKRMNKYRFKLEPYLSGGRNRYKCPQCGKNKTFTRYIDTQNEVKLPDYIGRCERVNNCGYSYSPYEYARDNREEWIRLLTGINRFILDRPKFEHTEPKKEPSYIDTKLVEQSLRNEIDANYFLMYLSSLFTDVVAQDLAKLYSIGTSKYWDRATVFWQIDELGNARAGKIMQYNPETGKRVKEPYNKVNWVHSVLKLENFSLEQCFFGEHLLRQFPSKPIAIVESEKTAIVAARCVESFVWIATGGISASQITSDRAAKILKNRDVTLFPDLGAEDDWTQIARTLSNKLSQNIKVSKYLTNEATPEQKAKGMDLADFLTSEEFRDNATGLLLSKDGYPLSWD
jgi:5S rRNA maturation endonuclease (ribonuclease M5)